jgi:hypothetical protein
MQSPIGNSRASAQAQCAVLLLGLLWAVETLLAELFPELAAAALPPLFLHAISLALSGTALCLVWLRLPKSSVTLNAKSAIYIGVGLFAAPAIALHFTSSQTSPYTRMALFALVPVFSVVLDRYLSRGDPRPIPGGLAATLAALLGATLVFPVSVPNSMEAAIALATVILAALISAAANCYAVAVCQFAESRNVVALAAIAIIAGAATLGVASTLLERIPAPSVTWRRNWSQPRSSKRPVCSCSFGSCGASPLLAFRLVSCWDRRWSSPSARSSSRLRSCRAPLSAYWPWPAAQPICS